MFTALRSIWQRQFDSWVDKRNPRQNLHRLSLSNLYVFPTGRGFLFLAFVMVLWLLGTNYQNNLILALTFLLVSIFVVSILHTYANLAEIEIELKGASQVYAGDNAEFFFSVTNTSKRERDDIGMRWQDSPLESHKFVLPGFANTKERVGLPSEKRGVLSPKRLLVETFFPFGLLRCWTWLKFDAHALVYPKPIEFPLSSASVSDDEGDGEHPVKGGEDFSALHEYNPGDSLKHIAWKLYARDAGLFTKEFSQNLSREIWLDFFHVKTPDVELKLSALCYWVLQFHQQDENYGLVLPGRKIPPNKGENHKAEILEALAYFEIV